MAGVGFELKKLFRARTVAGHLKAYSFSVLITTGPFIYWDGIGGTAVILGISRAVV